MKFNICNKLQNNLRFVKTKKLDFEKSSFQLEGLIDQNY